MNIKEKFLELTNRTYPHGTEKDVFSLLGDGLQEDEFGNLYIKIGESDVMFTSHLDTATSALTTIVHVEEGNIIKTDNKSILGADDKAGVTIMLYMIENKIPGLYYFFLGEEVGCIGSKKVAEKQKTEKIPGINKVISFDRRGKTSVITYQSGQRCCSDKFGQALADELNKLDTTFSYKNDPTGLLTDSIQFIKIYPECTNISVGYQNEHTFSEQQDIEHLEKLAKACLSVNWNDLPVERDPSKTEYSWSNYYDYDYGYDNYNYGNYSGTSYATNWNTKYDSNKSSDYTENIWFHDKDFNYVSKITIGKYTNKCVSVDLCPERIAKEKQTIDSLLKSLQLDFIETKWDGFKLDVKYEYGNTSTADRNDLIEYLPELDYSKVEELNDDEKAITEYLDEDFFD
jgi:putative aminopeptidase FrvX